MIFCLLEYTVSLSWVMGERLVVLPIPKYFHVSYVIVEMRFARLQMSSTKRLSNSSSLARVIQDNKCSVVCRT